MKVKIANNRSVIGILFVVFLIIASFLASLGIFFPQRIPWGERTIERTRYRNIEFALQQEFDNFFGEKYITYLYINKGCGWEQHQIDFESSRWFGSEFFFPVEDAVEVRHKKISIATYNFTTDSIRLSQTGVVLTGPNQVMPAGWSPN